MSHEKLIRLESVSLLLLAALIVGCVPPSTTLPRGIAAPTSTAGCAPAALDILSAWWTFDDSVGVAVRDQTANGNHGKRHNGVGATSGVFGSGALLLDGIDNYVEVPNSGSLNFGAGESLGFDFWISETGKATGGLKVILDKRAVAESAPNGYSVYTYQGRIGVQIADGKRYQNFTGPPLPEVTGRSWAFVAISIDRGAVPSITWFVNGTTTTTPAPSMPMGSLMNTAPLRIGAHSYERVRFPGIVAALDELEIIRGVIPAGLPSRLMTRRKCR